eukprot:12423152-Karenia_brevis.AAC.1
MAVMSWDARAFCKASATIRRPNLAFSGRSPSATCLRRKPRNHATASRPHRPRTSRTKGTRLGPG